MEVKIRSEIPGPLSPWLGEFVAELRRRGHTPLTIRERVRVIAQMSIWLEAEALDCAGLTSEVAERFLALRRERGHQTYVTVAGGVEPLLEIMRAAGAAPAVLAPGPLTPDQVVVERYRLFLGNERGLASRSVRQCVETAEKLLQVRADLGAVELRDVRAFIAVEAVGKAPKTVGHLVWTVRSFLRFLFVTGEIAANLAEEIPSVRIYTASALPDPLSADQLDAFIATCDPAMPIGRRDRAVLLLLARLGLRAGEVSRLRLDDVRWRAGELTVAGKGGRIGRLLLPVDVGEALAAYLHHDRPVVTTRAVFVGVRAPHRPMSGVSSLNRIVRTAGQRAGLGHVRPHQLRYSTASRLLAAGSPLSEIGQVLRHSSEEMTATYAKVDQQRLGLLARPWPVVSR